MCFILLNGGVLANILYFALTSLTVLMCVKWFSSGWCSDETLLFGKTIIVTGANAGIGKETARNFIKRGAKVILACRNLDKAFEAAHEIEKAGPGEVIVRHLDLASFKSVQTFAKEVLDSESRIDVLVNNAGIMCSYKSTTEDGNDLCLQSNYLGHFLLTNLLLERIKDSAPSRIINLSSLSHKSGNIYWDDINLNEPNNYSLFKAYNQTKLALVLFTKELADRLKDTGVNVYAVNPGVVSTDITRFLPCYCLQFLATLSMKILFKTATHGAQTTIYCAVSDKASHETGLYYSDCKVDSPSLEALNKASAKNLWECSEKMIDLQ